MTTVDAAKARLAEIEAKVTALQTHDSLDDTWPIAKAVRFAKQMVVEVPVLVAALRAVLDELEPELEENRVGYSGDEQHYFDNRYQFATEIQRRILEALGVGE